MSIERQIETTMTRLGITASFLCSLDGRISDSRLSHALSGRKPLDNRDAIRLTDLLRELENIMEIVRPIPIRFKNPEEIRPLLQGLRENDLGWAIVTNLVARENTKSNAACEAGLKELMRHTFDAEVVVLRPSTVLADAVPEIGALIDLVQERAVTREGETNGNTT